MATGWGDKWVHTVLLSTMGTIALGLSAVAQAQIKASSYTLTIPAAPLGDALNQFAQQTGLQVLFSSQLVAQMHSPRVAGSHTAEEALSQLLANSGLKFEFVNARTVTVVNVSSPPGQPGRSTDVAPEEKGLEQRSDIKDASARTVKTTASNNSYANSGGALTRGSGFFARLANILGVCTSASASSTESCAREAGAVKGGEVLAEVVVTGSRVVTNGNDSPTPVTAVSTEQLLEASPGTIAQALANLPALLATPNQGGQGPGPQVIINLRGIGGQRSLILFDGRRVAPTTTGNGVDTNLLPQMLVKRVDIVTGGASAVYGSDAVSGVVNYITDHNFNGLKFNALGGISTYGDDQKYDVGIAIGTRLFGGRGHIEFSYQYAHDPGIADRFDRKWGRGLWSMQGSVPGSTAAAGTTANPWNLYSNTRLNATSFGGLINACSAPGCSSALAGLQFAQNGVLSPFDKGTATGSTQQSIGGDGGYYTTVTAYALQDIEQGFGRFDFDFTDSVKAYAEFAATTVLNASVTANTEVRTKAIGYNNAYLATVQPVYQGVIAAQLAVDPLSSFNFSRILTDDQFPAPRNQTRGTQFLALTGLEGSLLDYQWSLGYEHSKATTTAKNPNNVSLPRLYAAMNAVVNNGQIVCNAAVVNPSVYGSCVPLNLFGPTATNRAAFDYIHLPTQVRNTYIMDDVTASITGAPISSWAGPIDMALSSEWRELSYEVVSNALPTDPVNCTGIQFNCVSSGATATMPYQAAAANFPESNLTVSEFAYEAQVPLLKGMPLAKSLGLNTAARYTDYSTSGPVWTWKLGLTWAMNDHLLLRVARSRDIRAPSLQNLFQPTSVSVTNITDLHTGVTGNTNNFSQGNPHLTPEEADTWTAGFIWRPEFMEGLSLSMDYYRIDIHNGLNGTSSRQPAAQQACENSGGASPICSLYIRPLPFSDHTAANFPIAIIDQSLNTAGLLAYGMDTDISYAHSIAGHDLKLRFLMNYQPHLIYDLGPSGILDVGGAADGVGGLPPTPNVKGTLQVNYEVIDNFTVTLQERYRNALKQNGSPLIHFAFGKQPPAWYTDMTFSYKMQVAGGDLETFLNVRNLFNEQPDPWASTGGNSQIGSFGGWAQGDDPMGRYFTAGVRYRL